MKPPFVSRGSPMSLVRAAQAPMMQPRPTNSYDPALQQEGYMGQSAGPPKLWPEPQLFHEPGGDALSRVLHPAFTVTEHLFRVLPEDSWFSPLLNSRRPFKFQFGSFKVPKSQFFLVLDYEFSPLRQSGVDPFDFVKAESHRFGGFMGFDITVGGRRMSDLFYQLDPAPVQLARASFGAPIGEPRGAAAFNIAAANSFGSPSGEGTSLLPVRPGVQGARGMPFTLIASPDSQVALSCVIFRRITAPLAAIEATMSGYLFEANTMSALLNRVRPR